MGERWHAVAGININAESMPRDGATFGGGLVGIDGTDYDRERAWETSANQRPTRAIRIVAMNWHDLGTLILLLSPGLLLSAIVMGIFAAGG